MSADSSLKGIKRTTQGEGPDINLCVLVFIIVVLLQFAVLFSSSPHVWEAIGRAGGVKEAIAQGSDREEPAGEDAVLTAEGMYEVSTNENVIVFVVDMLDEEFIEGIVAEDPGFFDNLDGFTRFTNNMSRYNQTFPSVVNALTGIPYDYTLAKDRYIEEAYASGTFVADIRAQGYSCSLYIEKGYEYTENTALAGLADNLYVPAVPATSATAVSASSSVEGEVAVAETEASEPYSASDVHADIAFYEGLKESGLEMADTPGRFALYHLYGSHYDWHMDENARYVEDETSGIEQTKGVFVILDEYFDQMKELGIYEDATIIITGDHPTHTSWMELEKPMLVGLFVKPAGEAGTPLRYNAAPVSIENLAATCVEAAGGDKAPWGRTYYEVGEGEEVVRYYSNRYSTDGGANNRVAEYRVVGDARDWRNWRHLESLPDEMSGIG